VESAENLICFVELFENGFYGLPKLSPRKPEESDKYAAHTYWKKQKFPQNEWYKNPSDCDDGIV
jgi:hypothetical protein